MQGAPEVGALHPADRPLCPRSASPCSRQGAGQWPTAAQLTELLPVGPHPRDSTGQPGHGSRAPGTARGPSWGFTRAAGVRDTGAAVGRPHPARPPLVSDRGLGRMARGSMVGGPGSLHTDFPSVAFVSSLWGRNVCFTTSPRSFRKWGPLDAAGGGCSLCSLVTRLRGTPGALAFSTLALRQMCKYADTSVCPTRVASPRVHCWPGSGQVLRGAGLPHVLCAPDV